MKRSATEMAVTEYVAKKPRLDLVVAKGVRGVTLPSGPARSSGLLAPNMRLTGHDAEIYTVKFSPDGQSIASAGKDRQLFLWNTYGDCENFALLKGHKNCILDLQWGRNNDLVYTASADKTGAMYDVVAGERVKRFRGHSLFVNSISVSRRGDEIVATGSDDCTAMIWDVRSRHPIRTLQHEYQVTSVAFSDDSSQLFTAGVNPNIQCWDFRMNKVEYTMQGHKNLVTGIRLSPDGSHLLSNSADRTIRTWDVRPYVQGSSRAVAILEGHQHDFQQQLLKASWSHDGTRIAAGSADRFVYVWDVKNQRILYKLPGHQGCVNEVDFHPVEPIIASCSNDKVIFVGEIL